MEQTCHPELHFQTREMMEAKVFEVGDLSHETLQRLERVCNRLTLNKNDGSGLRSVHPSEAFGVVDTMVLEHAMNGILAKVPELKLGVEKWYFQQGHLLAFKARAVRDVSTGKDRSELCILLCVERAVTDMAVTHVLIPVNFSESHWCGIVVKVFERRIAFYDPLHQDDHLRALRDIVEAIRVRAVPGYSHVQVNTPIQQGMFSCGVFVAWLFLRLVEPALNMSMDSGAQLTRRRFELFYLVLNGHLPPSDPTRQTTRTPAHIGSARDVEMRQVLAEDHAI